MYTRCMQMTCNISLDFILVLFENPITTSLKLIIFVFAKIDLLSYAV